MRSSAEIVIDTGITREAAISRLKAALADDQRRTANNYMPLAGEVSEQRVVLYRRRGAFPWYGTFHGRFHEKAQGVRLVGSFKRSMGFMSLWAGFCLLWAAILMIATFTRWKGAESIGWLLAAVVATGVGVFTISFRGKNADAEVEILRGEIDRIFRRHGA